MNILFFTPVNFRCRDVESLALKFKSTGHKVILLSQCKKGPLHEILEKNQISTFVHHVNVSYAPFKILIQLAYLVYFSWRHKIDVLFSHLEPTNFVSVIAQYLIKARVIIYRHHFDLARLSNFDKSFTYRTTYKYAKTIITVSECSRQYMIKEENIRAEKIHQINLGYDFSLYAMPSADKVKLIREQYSTDLLLIAVGRLDRFKRPGIAVKILERLTNEFGVNAKLIFLGQGELQAELQQYCTDKGLSERVIFLGYVGNVLEYLAAADFLIHPSISESSSVAIKEAALVDLPVIVCKGIGDFEEYIKDQVNGFLVYPDSMVEEAVDIIVGKYKERAELALIGKALKTEIRHRFSIDSVILHYNKLLYALFKTSGKESTDNHT